MIKGDTGQYCKVSIAVAIKYHTSKSCPHVSVHLMFVLRTVANVHQTKYFTNFLHELIYIIDLVTNLLIFPQASFTMDILFLIPFKQMLILI